jgi:hypothetical protein
MKMDLLLVLNRFQSAFTVNQLLFGKRNLFILNKKVELS